MSGESSALLPHATASTIFPFLSRQRPFPEPRQTTAEVRWDGAGGKQEEWSLKKAAAEVLLRERVQPWTTQTENPREASKVITCIVGLLFGSLSSASLPRTCRALLQWMLDLKVESFKACSLEDQWCQPAQYTVVPFAGLCWINDGRPV